MMESAIPAHLRSERTQSRRMPEGYAPPYPSYVARHAASVKRVVMAYFGLQYRGDDAPPAVRTALNDAAFECEHAPGHWDRARYVDEAGFTNTVSIAYWDAPATFDAWFAQHGASWARRAVDGAGTFSEVLRPAVERYETLFSANDRPEGIAVLADGMSDIVQEHAYWGGARDRIPLSQTDALASKRRAARDRRWRASTCGPA
jgi:aldoxime dehydratase